MQPKHTMLKYFLIAAATSCALAASALDFTATPGGLADAFENPESVDALTLRGAVDASDLFFIADKMTGLTELNLRDVIIREYSGATLKGRTTYEANTIPAGTFAACRFSSVILPTLQGTCIGETAFAGSAITSLEIPEGTAIVGMGAFSSCPQLTTVTLPAVKTQGHTFANCPKLTVATLNGVTDLAESTFEECSALTVINGTDILTTIGERAFAGCSALSQFDFGSDLRSIGQRSFMGTALTEADLTGCSRLDVIGTWAFAHCANLTSAKLADNTTVIGKGAFFDCSALRSINLPKNCTAINDYTFKGNIALDIDYLMHDDVSNVAAYAFKGVEQTGAVHLPKGLTYLGQNAMAEMTSLRTIYAYGVTAVAALGEDVWAGIDQSTVTLYVDEEMADQYKAADQWREFNILTTGSTTTAENELTPSVRAFFSGDNLLVTANGTDMTYVAAYTVGGTLLAEKRNVSDTATFAAAGWGRQIIIVECHLDGGGIRIFKLTH